MCDKLPGVTRLFHHAVTARDRNVVFANLEPALSLRTNCLHTLATLRPSDLECGARPGNRGFTPSDCDFATASQLGVLMGYAPSFDWGDVTAVCNCLLCAPTVRSRRYRPVGVVARLLGNGVPLPLGRFAVEAALGSAGPPRSQSAPVVSSLGPDADGALLRCIQQAHQAVKGR